MSSQGKLSQDLKDYDEKTKEMLKALALIASTTKSLAAIEKADAESKRKLSRLAMRKLSIGMSEITGIKPIERTSAVGLEYKRPILTYLPTYQLNPRVPLSLHQITIAVDQVLDVFFNGHVYQQALSSAVATRIAAIILRTLKLMFFDRYRILCVVAIGQKRSQSYSNAIAFIWDGERDAYVDRHREEPTAFIQVTVFLVYLD